ncbi:MAG: formyltetrahydrofolate deformylase [Solirubrobacterales bacterium]|nr:formyltetrahydrofolate deformylase [Solirubrobacterales bacterium]
MAETDQSARLLVSCEDRPGIVAAVSAFLLDAGANIVTSDQYSSDPSGGRFFLRMSFQLDGVVEHRDELETRFAEIAAEFQMDRRFSYGADTPRVALMVSKYDHCLMDLLWRTQRGELAAEISLVVSNHPDLAEAVEGFDIPFQHIPVAKDDKPAAEAAALEALAGNDLVVLARYMQILSGDFLERLGCPVINIHHSFLPAFAGAGPYERARERGVKLIGATAHYVTEDLDAGPIIEQDVLRVNHRYTAADLERVGRDVERVALARAVRSHLDDRVLIDGHRAIVF